MTKEQLTTIDITDLLLTDLLIFSLAIGFLGYSLYKSFTDDY
jgi:hypothetical protein